MQTWVLPWRSFAQTLMAAAVSPSFSMTGRVYGSRSNRSTSGVVHLSSGSPSVIMCQ